MRMDVIESEHLLNARLAYAVAFASLHANPGADLEKGADRTYDLYVRALHCMPYVGAEAAANTDSAALEREREDAIKRWREMQANASKDTGT